MSKESSSLLQTRREGRVLIVSINNPPYNLLTGDILLGLARILRSLDVRDTGAVVMASAISDVFISHYSVDEILEFGELLPPFLAANTHPWMLRGLLAVETGLSYLGLRPLLRMTPLKGLAHLNGYAECAHLLRSIPQVTVAAVNGRAFGGGCELALSCDFRVMVDTPPEGTADSRGCGIGQPEIVLGLIPGGGGTQMLTRMLGPAQALELCLEGTLISGEEALKYGLITKLVSREQLMPEAMAIAERMARRNPAAVAAIKDCVHTGGSSPLAVGIRREQGGFGTSALVPEAANAMTKYLSGIDELLGPKSNLADFQAWKDGTAVDFTPGSARKLQASKKQV